LTVEVLRTYPHDPEAFTEGLAYVDGEILESTGLKGHSQLRRVSLETGAVIQAIDVASSVFAEGIALHDDRVVQLTLDSQQALVWDAQTLLPRDEYRYDGPGWGLCHNGRSFVMSDGSNVLQVRDSRTFEIIDRIEIGQAEAPFRFLRFNELECFGDDIYANVQQFREIARISLSKRALTAWIDTRNLLNHPDVPEEYRATALELNGIAHVAERDVFLVTGKLWPRIFEVRLVPDQLFQ
jgi:glutaminyl-peptide cyclotransferase